MTLQEAKNILSQYWWTNHPLENRHNDFNIHITDDIQETADDDIDYPDCFLFNIYITEKEKKPTDENVLVEFAVSKKDGNCRPAIRWSK